TAVVLGVVLSVIMGAANVYLGLKAGMTVSASIPAAVVSMGILRGIFRRSSTLESNLVQTAASAGESLAAGIIFTMPALIIVGVWNDFDFWVTSLIALTGGLLGILLMIPMRQVFVVDNQELKYPEGVACAEVLRAGEGSDSKSDGLLLMVMGICVGGIFKLAQSTLGLLHGSIEGAVVRANRVFFFGCDISPALFSVGYIITLPIALEIFAGGFIGWLIGIPLLGLPDSTTAELSVVDLAYQLWSTKIRYIGVGAMIVGGVVSIWNVRKGLAAAVNQLVDLFSNTTASAADVLPTERNLSSKTILLWGVLTVATIAGLYWKVLGGNVPLTLLITGVMLLMSFFFSAVASYIVGLVGNSNSPVSGMTITAVLGTGVLLYVLGFTGHDAILATLGVAGVVCCVACTSGDVCNDLKTGHMIGASPRSQQIMQIIGVSVAAFVMAPVMTILHQGSLKAGTGGIGGEELAAPQAGLFAALVNGFFGSNGQAIPKDMVAYGAIVGVCILLADSVLNRFGSKVRLHLMPVAVGIYLPLGISVPMVLGGLVRTVVDRLDTPGTETKAHRGILIVSGLIAGESLMGVFTQLLSYLEVPVVHGADVIGKVLSLSDGVVDLAGQWISLAALLAIAALVFMWSSRTREEK
ncbi:MAG: oligopeptide transporter, OPT family, partial [Planctomycetales bacterium]|nr:oligopeptide transporter, OPT family [Planctomycetales bacterium]